MYQILSMSCSGDISSCCSDYGIATYINIVKKALDIIHIVVPIVLIVMATVQLIRLMADPDDSNKSLKKVLLNKFIAAVIIFFLPFVVNLTVKLVVPKHFELSRCWDDADDIVTVMDEYEEYYKQQNNSVRINTHESTYNGVSLKYGVPPRKSNSSGDSSNSSSSSDDTTDTQSSSGSEKGKKLVKYAQKFLGNKYVYGGTSLTNGTDCSGFTMQVYKHFGINLPRTSRDQSKVGKKVNASTKSMKAGDLIFYGNGNSVGHVAIYMGNGKVIHASNPKSGIKTSTWNYRTPIVIRRVID